MKYLLDTDICIYLIKHKPVSVLNKLRGLPNTDVALSVISVFELQFGVENSLYRDKSQSALDHFVGAIPNTLVVDQVAAIYAAKIRGLLKTKGRPVGPFDLLIAATALAHNLILVSNNTKEFSRIDGLKLENWV